MEPLHSSRNTVAVLALVVGFALGAVAVSFNGAGKGLQGTLVPPPGSSSSTMSQQVTAMPGKAKKYCSCSCNWDPGFGFWDQLCIKNPLEDDGRECDVDYDLGQLSDEACAAVTGTACRGFTLQGKTILGKLACASVYVADEDRTPSSAAKPLTPSTAIEEGL